MADLGGYDPELDGPAEPARGKTADNLREIAEFDGNLADLMSEDVRKRLGAEVARETAYDENNRKEWLEGVERAIKNARQKPEPKDYPFVGASNMKYPLLTTAAMQFNARAHGALTRGDQPLVAKVQGEDQDGSKARKAARVSRFANYQLMYEMDEWDDGTDKLTYMLPVMGAGFRKATWRTDLGRPCLEFTNAKSVIVPADSPSFERAPRITQPCSYYPYEIDHLVESGQWLQHRRDSSAADEDTQRALIYYEQQRYIDLDGDGLMEPYIVTVSKEHEEIVRIDPAFWAESIQIGESGGVESIARESPWVPYSFIPDIEGGVYGVGFGQLLESLGSGVNTALNQIFDAAHRQNAGGGFIANGLRLRGGEIQVRPAQFTMVNASTGRISDSIHELQFAGPSPVLFQVMEFLLGASRDITSVKDALTGEAPSGQAMGTTLALIEQGQQVFNMIYTRLFRALRREFRLLMRLNARHLDPRKYARFLDDQRLFAEMMGPPPGAMPAPGGMAMGRPAQAPPPKIDIARIPTQALQPLLADFDVAGMDISPSADPRAITDMQRMMRAQYLGQFLGQPGINPREIQRRQLEAANVEDIDKLFLDGPSPMDELNAELAKQELRKKAAEAATEEERTKLVAKQAEKTRQEANDSAFERGAAIGMAGGVPDMAGASNDPSLLSMPGSAAATPGSPMGAIPVGPSNGPADA